MPRAAPVMATTLPAMRPSSVRPTRYLLRRSYHRPGGSGDGWPPPGALRIGVTTGNNGHHLPERRGKRSRHEDPHVRPARVLDDPRRPARLPAVVGVHPGRSEEHTSEL